MKRVAARLLVIAVWVITVLVLVATLLPLWETNVWWVRFLDFPRLQIAIIAATVLVIALFLRGSSRVVVPLIMIGACAYQLWRISSYTPFVPTEMTAAADNGASIRVLSANIQMENDRYDLLTALVERYDPDILLLMETDQAWVDAILPMLQRYPTVVLEPRDNRYGMVFATRLKVEDARIVYLTEDDTPSVFAQLRGPEGTRFRFVGLHPRPPVPGQSTKERDAQIYYAARFARQSGIPLIATGDFNDVAWSDTSQMFKHVGRYLDPRIGRGFFASFDATRFYLRFPIDQIYVTEDVVMVAIERHDDIGSDHFPISATLRLDAQLAARLNTTPPQLTEDELEAIMSSVARSRETLGHPDLIPD